VYRDAQVGPWVLVFAAQTRVVVCTFVASCGVSRLHWMHGAYNNTNHNTLNLNLNHDRNCNSNDYRNINSSKLSNRCSQSLVIGYEDGSVSVYAIGVASDVLLKC
jgi:hypothetical protein